MIHFFNYNWQVRDEWFQWCEQLEEDELHKKRRGGAGSILHTLLHISDVEYSWIRVIQGLGDTIVDFEEYRSLTEAKQLSDSFRRNIRSYFAKGLIEAPDFIVSVPWDDDIFSKNEILHHIIAHEIHHIGQLSVWARELGLAPVSANLLGRDLKTASFID
ncbi:DinB family protein [Bacillus sp. AG4(2022)]|uniref:DinB family protein n=1 Tax=Bacillus sp. AG4(2022) TaxID=2962594 RepID=UPI002881025F|nr:DinB family protein [Bacillus sp. AG4(2022)]MDT0162440.1 DinB family protein [Bacillus sp. AG4(2022)]